MKMSPKDTAAMIVGMGDSPAPMDDAAMPKEEGSEDEDVIAAEIMTAVKNGDQAAFKEGLKSFIEVCRAGDKEGY